MFLGVNGIVHLYSFTSYNIAAAIGVALALLLRFTIGLAAGAPGSSCRWGHLLHGSSVVPSWVFHGLSFAVPLGIWGLWELRPSAAPEVSSPLRSRRPSRRSSRRPPLGSGARTDRLRPRSTGRRTGCVEAEPAHV